MAAPAQAAGPVWGCASARPRAEIFLCEEGGQLGLPVLCVPVNKENQIHLRKSRIPGRIPSPNPATGPQFREGGGMRQAP